MKERMNNQNAPRSVYETGGRHAKDVTLTPEHIISQLKCITNLGGVQVSALPYPKREEIYCLGKREFLDLRTPRCSYDDFIHQWVEVCRV